MTKEITLFTINDPIRLEGTTSETWNILHDMIK